MSFNIGESLMKLCTDSGLFGLFQDPKSLIMIAVACFTAQFAFTKVFESSARQTALTTFVMLTVTSVIGIILCLCIGRFKVYVTLFSLLWALVYAIIMFPYYIIGNDDL